MGEEYELDVKSGLKDALSILKNELRRLRESKKALEAEELGIVSTNLNDSQVMLGQCYDLLAKLLD